MTDARLRRFWHRAGILSALGAFTVAAAAQGCSGGDAEAPSFDLAADGPSAFDATPDPDGTTLYFTGLTEDGTPGVFKVPADGSAKTPVAVATGGLLSAPVGIGISGDGKSLFVADPGVDVVPTGAEAGNDKGAILTVAAAGGELAPLAGSEDTQPRSLDIVEEDGKDVLYFTGTDKSDDQAAVFSIPAAGGTAKVVLKGGLLRDPSGIAVAADGAIYVANTVSSDSETADVIKILDGKATKVISGLRVGYPCGIAVNMAGTGLLISALDPETLTDIVISVDLSTEENTPTTIASETISSFSESAGLHRARNKDVFGWADGAAGAKGGSVFLVH